MSCVSQEEQNAAPRENFAISRFPFAVPDSHVVVLPALSPVSSWSNMYIEHRGWRKGCSEAVLHRTVVVGLVLNYSLASDTVSRRTEIFRVRQRLQAARTTDRFCPDSAFCFDCAEPCFSACASRRTGGILRPPWVESLQGVIMMDVDSQKGRWELIPCLMEAGAYITSVTPPAPAHRMLPQPE